MAMISSEHGDHQHIYGAVSRNGDKYFGEGFASRQLKEGTYLIEFERPFAKEPAITCTIFGHEWHTFDKSVAVLDISQSHVIVCTSTPHRPESCGFMLIAFGDA